MEGYHLAGPTRLSVVDGPGEGIETDRIGVEGRPYEDEDEEADKGGIVLRRRGYWRTMTAWLGVSPPLVGRMVGNVWMGVETSEKETPLGEIDTSYYSRHNNQLENLVP